MKCLTAILALFILLMPVKAHAARALSIDLASDHVDITTGFTGSNLVLFGTRKPGAAIVVVVEGPHKNMVVRRKSQVAGVWMNTRYQRFTDVPLFYSYAIGADEEDDFVLPDKLAKRHGIGAEHIINRPKNISDAEFNLFREALMRNKQTDGLFAAEPTNIDFLSDRLFRTSIYMPGSVPKGQYNITTYMIENNEIVESAQTRLRVEQIGFGAQLSLFSRDFGFAYGLLCVAMAVFAGWFMNSVRFKV